MLMLSAKEARPPRRRAHAAVPATAKSASPASVLRQRGARSITATAMRALSLVAASIAAWARAGHGAYLTIVKLSRLEAEWRPLAPVARITTA